MVAIVPLTYEDRHGSGHKNNHDKKGDELGGFGFEVHIAMKSFISLKAEPSSVD